MINLYLLTTLVAFLMGWSVASPLVQIAIFPDPPSTSTVSSPVSTGISVSAPTYTPLPQANITALQHALLMAPSQTDREAILFPNVPNANNVTFQFINNTVTPPEDGTIAVGSVHNIPALIGTNLAFAVGFVGPCGLNVPHLHPRANEFLTVVEGLLIGAFVLEDDAESDVPLANVAMTLTNYTGMLFPMGHVHWQFNPTCEQAVFTSGFDSNDDGRSQIAQTFFSITPDFVLQTATGGILGPAQIDQVRDKIPSKFVELVDSCATACGLPTS